MKLNLKSNPQFYADDGLFKFQANSFEQLTMDMQNDLKQLSEWLEINQLTLNITKTKILLLNNHRNIEMEHFIGMNFDGGLIKRETEIKYLGLIIDEKLSWTEHVNKIINKLSAISFAIYRMKKIVPKKLLWNIYHAHFMSHITYLNPIWNGCSQQLINRIQRLQNRVIKTIENKHRLTPTSILYENRLNIKKYGQLQTIITIHKIKINQFKFNGQLNQINSIHNRILRNIWDYRPKLFKKEKCKMSIQSNGTTLYNRLDNDIKQINEIIRFKKNVEKYLIINSI